MVSKTSAHLTSGYGTKQRSGRARPNVRSRDRCGREDFVYDTVEDVYRCPAGEKLTYRMTSEQDGKMMRRYWTNVCPTCPLKRKCTTGNERRIPTMGARARAGSRAEAA